MITKVWAIVKTDHGVDGRGEPTDIIKKVFDCKLDAMDAVFKPYVIKEIDVDTRQVLFDLSVKLTEIQKYSIGCYNEKGIKDYLLLGQK
jgi:hypothetical protein